MIFKVPNSSAHGFIANLLMFGDGASVVVYGATFRIAKDVMEEVIKTLGGGYALRRDIDNCRMDCNGNVAIFAPLVTHHSVGKFKTDIVVFLTSSMWDEMVEDSIKSIREQCEAKT